MSTIHVEIVSAEGEIYSGDAEMVVAPASLGDVGITPRHAPLMTNLRPGEVRIKVPDETDEVFIYVTGGVLEVQPHLVTVLADSALHGDQLDEQAALDAHKLAEAELAGATGKEDIVHAQLQLVEAAARYSAAQKLKGRRS
ncbi:MAG: F0F1 ATP synthase subunit epsilon [Gammaproteobacteria bacterium]|jgi:F-type H+-transporting ATPase subunit epsilon|nr:F0F1 ATP synthase subunit epsilon [Chromatiales bacterium]MDP6674353.1 F0F1 ATP synthase subunit epsilon [Gammaproteobacteria bacterium]